jgi:hypothetical protein
VDEPELRTAEVVAERDSSFTTCLSAAISGS